MKHLSLTILVMLIQAFGVAAQSNDEKERRAQEVQTAVSTMIAAGNDKVIGVRNDLRVFEGKLIQNVHDRFVIETKKTGRLDSVKYADVLEIEGKDIFLSYIPDPNLKPFADWNAIRRL